jgi:CheY-like chemotaxis protein
MSKILAIDDSPTLRKFISKHLGERFPEDTVLLAGNGADGVAAAQKEKPDVILLDYLLPDCKGDEVCEKLQADPSTADIPIILMSSSTPDITRTEGRFPSIKRSMAKPFSPELLCASVNFLLTVPVEEDLPQANGERAADFSPESAPTVVISSKLQKVTLAQSKPVPPPPGQTAPAAARAADVEFSGNLAAFPLIRLLLAAQLDHLTGVLKLEAPALRIELFFRNGLPVLATTRDVEFYLREAPVKVPPEQADLFEALKKEQETSGEPIFLQMKTRELIPAETADTMVRDYSGILFAHAWTLAQGRFVFEKLEALPAYAGDLPALEESVEQFALVSLRNLSGEASRRFATEAAPGIPAYNPAGYVRIQSLVLEPEEAAFAEWVGTGGKDLAQIAEALQIDLAASQVLLERFLALEIFDYWPAPPTE